MSPVAVAALLFGITALGGAYMVWLMAKNRPFPNFPLPLVHGLFAAVALLTLWGVVANRLADGTAPSILEWDGKNIAGRAVAPGTYWLRLEAAGREAAARLVKLP